MRPTTMMTMLACLCAAACSRNDTNSNETNGSATNTHVPGPNALNNNPSGATPMTNDPSGVAPNQPPSADGVEFAGGGHEAGVAVGGGPNGTGAASGSGSGDSDKGSPGVKGAKRTDDKMQSCPGDKEVRVMGKNDNAGFCARACRSDNDCAPKGKCDGVGHTSAKGYAQPNGKYCTGM